MSASSRRSNAPESVRVKEIARKVQDSARGTSASDCNSNSLTVNHPPAWHRKCRATFRHEAVTCAYLPSIFPGVLLRRDELLRPDVMSELILLGAGALVLAILILTLIVVLTQASAPV